MEGLERLKVRAFAIKADAIGNPKILHSLQNPKDEKSFEKTIVKCEALQNEYNGRCAIVEKNYHGYLQVKNDPRYINIPDGLARSERALVTRFNDIIFGVDGKIVSGKLTSPIVSGTDLKAFLAAWNKFIGNGPSVPKKAKKDFDMKAFRDESVVITQNANDHELYGKFQELYQIVEDSAGSKGYEAYRKIADKLLKIKKKPVGSKLFTDVFESRIQEEEEEEEEEEEKDSEEEDEEEGSYESDFVEKEDRRKKPQKNFEASVMTMLNEIKTAVTAKPKFKLESIDKETGLPIPGAFLMFPSKEAAEEAAKKLLITTDQQRYTFSISKV
jgi:hypothetical protein